jgi:hypothetical protein
MTCRHIKITRTEILLICIASLLAIEMMKDMHHRTKAPEDEAFGSSWRSVLHLNNRS